MHLTRNQTSKCSIETTSTRKTYNLHVDFEAVIENHKVAMEDGLFQCPQSEDARQEFFCLSSLGCRLSGDYSANEPTV